MFLLCFCSLRINISQQTKSSSSKSPVLLESLSSRTLIKIPYYKLTEKSGNWDSPDYTSRFISTTDPSAKLSYTFYGTKCYIVAHKGPGKGILNINIDELFEVSIKDLNQDNAESNVVVFESEELTVGQHTIQISNHPSSNGNSINVAYIYYRPYYDDSTFRLEFCHKYSPCINGEYFQPPRNGQTSVKFYGSRFWLTGIHKGQLTGSITITLDGKKTTFSKPEAHPSGQFSNQEVGVLIHSLDGLELTDHELTIECSTGDLGLVSLFFNPHPYNAVYVPSSEILTGCPEGISDCIDKSTPNCLHTIQAGTTFGFNMYGTKFWVIGDMSPVDDTSELYSTVSTQSDGLLHTFSPTAKDPSSLGLAAFFNSSFELIEDRLYIKYTPQNPDPSTRFITIYNFFYLNEQNIQDPAAHSSIEFSSLNPPEGWKVFTMDDGIQKYLYSTQKDARLDITFSGYKFWLEGTVGPNLGRIRILIDDTERYPNSNFGLYREKQEDGVVYYESADLPLKTYRISLIAVDDAPITFTRLLYNFSSTESFTASNGFSYSEYFTESTDFSKSIGFSKSITFTNSECFTTSTRFSDSLEFTESDNFSSFEFSASDLFSKSDKFSHSTNFSSSVLFDDPPKGQNGNQSSNIIYIIIGVVGAIIVVAVIVLIILIYLRKRRKQEDLEENAFEANAANYSIQSVTNNEDDDEPNSFASDIFKYKFQSYEEDQNDFGKT